MKAYDSSLLMVFMKNQVKGKVKTRLASTVGDELAFEVYNLLISRTTNVISQLEGINIEIHFSDFIDENLLGDSQCEKFIQQGDDLGQRMRNAFANAFKKGFKKIVIIGSDCFDLNVSIIYQSFEVLEKKNIVIGPANDGGYYLLGMKSPCYELFEGISWSTGEVLCETLLVLKKKGLSYELLIELADIDTEDDLRLIYH